MTAKLVPDGGNSLDLVLTNTGATALTPGVANGTAFTGNFLNPAGAKLLAISVTNGSSITGTIRNDGLVPEGITIANSTLGGLGREYGARLRRDRRERARDRQRLDCGRGLNSGIVVAGS